MSKNRRQVIIDGNWDSGWLAGHDTSLGAVLAYLRVKRSITPAQGTALIDEIGVWIAQKRKRLQRQEDWGDALCETVETCVAWLTDEQRERIRAALG
jgi:hypothetical protein